MTEGLLRQMDGHPPLEGAPSMGCSAPLRGLGRSSRSNLRTSLALLAPSRRRLWCNAAPGAELRPEAHVDQRPQLGGSKIRQRGITPAPHRGTALGSERLHLVLDLQN